MNCYDFENYISAYLDGDLKPNQRKEFTEHKSACAACQEKLDDIREMLSAMNQVGEVKTSPDFMSSLQQKIDDYESGKTSLVHRILSFRPFGLEPLPAIGFAAAILLMTLSTIMIFNSDRVPNIDFNQLSHKQQQINSLKGQPNLNQPGSGLYAGQTDTTAADSALRDPNNFDNIQFVNQQGNP